MGKGFRLTYLSVLDGLGPMLLEVLDQVTTLGSQVSEKDDFAASLEQQQIVEHFEHRGTWLMNRGTNLSQVGTRVSQRHDRRLNLTGSG